VAPVDAQVKEAQHVAQEYGADGRNALSSASRGIFISSTMLEMKIANTASLNASIRPSTHHSLP
jgi:uncharacterized protein YdiU (UPF0061 family)